MHLRTPGRLIQPNVIIHYAFSSVKPTFSTT